MNKKLREIVIAGILTAFSILIAATFPKLPLPQPFTLTLGSHVPTMIAMFISPLVTVFTVIGSIIGFWIATGNPIVMLRAASHIIFAVVGMYMLKKNANIFLVIIVTLILHATAELALVYFLTGILTPDALAKSTITSLSYIAFVGTAVHHVLDSIVTSPILFALEKAKLINTKVFGKNK